MNDTETSDSIDSFGISSVILIYSVVSMFALLILIFPFYVVVIRANRKKDKLLTVYPIISHFYKAIRFFYSILFIFIIYVIYRCYAYPDIGYIETLQLTSIIGTLSLMAIFVQAHNFLIILLSFQRFYIFFYQKERSRNTGKYIELNAVKIYLLFYILHILFVIWYIREFTSRDIMFLTYMIFYGFLNFVLLLSSFLYVPMVLKIRRLTSISSSNHHENLKYIFYQTLTIVLFKLSHTWAVCFLETGNYTLENYILLFLFMDLISTPSLIQVSYLLCNSKNVGVIRNLMKFDKIRSTNWMPSLRSSRVHSTHQADMTTSRV
ncbi:Protein CBG05002 [Caenorhabditis briggsae]|uniref:Protein CBG05002 n=1 Tax=Caenorhabditis briggsae TaxID=6238 RepID=A8WYY7_CAEBR|nr:Protein CBG05002 [Caenorhabditis briggsae]CAP25595.1 Protein CBG05002 [Caenorhabditis briggsae]